MRHSDGEEGFAVDRHAAAGRKSHCKACDRKRRKGYYAAHKDEWNAKRAAAREAAWQAELEALAEKHRKRVAAVKKLHAAQGRRQKEFLRSIGVPDLSPEEITERARRPVGRTSLKSLRMNKPQGQIPPHQRRQRHPPGSKSLED